MRKKIIIITTSLIILLMLSLYFSSISNAAIEIKPGGAVHTNIDVSTAYQYCYDMRSSASTLGNNTLDPHLTLNADWAAVTYLGASAYGNVRDLNGPGITINGTTYNGSTTNNITGVMVKAANVYTSSLLNADGEYSSNSTNLVKNKNTKYVELLDTTESLETTRGLSITETNGWYGSSINYPTSTSEPVIIRGVLFGMTKVNGAYYGSARSYRPVIWN